MLIIPVPQFFNWPTIVDTLLVSVDNALHDSTQVEQAHENGIWMNKRLNHTLWRQITSFQFEWPKIKSQHIFFQHEIDQQKHEATVQV